MQTVLKIALALMCLGVSCCYAVQNCSTLLKCHECTYSGKCYFKYFLDNEKQDLCIDANDKYSIKLIRGYGVSELENCLSEGDAERLRNIGKKISVVWNPSGTSTEKSVEPGRNGTEAADDQGTSDTIVYIGGSVVGVGVAFGITVLLVIYCRKKRQNQEYPVAFRQEVAQTASEMNVENPEVFEIVDLV